MAQAYAIRNIAATCTATCSTIGIGAVAGGGLQGLSQTQSGEFSFTKLVISAAIGAAGGTGSLFGKNLAQNMVGAAAGAVGATFLSNIPAVANDEIGADQVLIAMFTNAAAASGGTAIGAGVAKGLAGIKSFGGANRLSNGGAALGTASGETGSAAGVNLLTQDDE